MSKKASRSSSAQYVPRATLPKLAKIKTAWDLKQHYYTNDTDPQIEIDAKIYEGSIAAFCKKFKRSQFTKDAESLLRALLAYEVLTEMPEGSRVMRYFSFRTTLNVNDTAANKKLSQYGERFRKLSNDMLFFGLSIGKIPKVQQKLYLNDPLLQKYRYFLYTEFLAARHHLTEPEERILQLRAKTSSAMWSDAVDKVVSNRSITFKGERLAIPEALERIDLQNKAGKRELWKLIMAEMKDISEFAEHELTAIVSHEKVSDELRGFKKPYSGTVLAYENNEKSVEALVQAISTKGFALSKKFYQIKARLHGQKSIPYVQKYDSLGKLSEPDLETAVTICRDTFYRIKPEYGAIFDRMLGHGQIDVYPKAGKRGGAFMSATIGLPTFVMLNHLNNYKSLETLAHEMGHAVHAERSKVQPALYEDFSIVTAETASTLFEQLALESILEQLSDREKIIFLHDKILRNIATVQRQIACFNFELEMHTHIRREGMATKEELAKLMQKHLKTYLGNAVEVTEDDGYSYVHWSHIRYGFYVYSYAYGYLMSNLMVQRYKKDPSYVEKIDAFLTAGGKDTVENIFKLADIDATNIATFTDSLATQAKEIALLEKLTR
ncbi:MAG: M3 family metallopeptidase [Patescibacteria group bacterium]